MRRNRIHFGFGQTAKAVATAFAVVLVLVLGCFAVSSSLHQRLHTDSDRPDHFCVISAFATGQLRWTETMVVVITACVFLFYGASRGETPLVSYLDFYFSPNRAPPRS
jgi:H+/Cl- antiporter ClcA